MYIPYYLWLSAGVITILFGLLIWLGVHHLAKLAMEDRPNLLDQQWHAGYDYAHRQMRERFISGYNKTGDILDHLDEVAKKHPGSAFSQGITDYLEENFHFTKGKK